MTRWLLYIIGLLLTTTIAFYLLWRKQVHTNEQVRKDFTEKLEKANLETFKLIADIRVIEARRSMRDSLLSINKKNRENEKIKLLEDATASDLHAIILQYSGAK